ncbi:hypothetical protein ACFPVS_08965 [Neisseria weixii]|uniref:hypothetical protein n=1 Tax=Neisseria weixii TaxID=1853276 RepID=UPI000BB79B4F|nr:hypothetical protein [Neisseria weixii]ATD64114.1 hypothetical protein CGZ65_00015 [Neisseria weixii]ATD65878.1 hypothetical protein CGZ65_12575 [Neisseria weixii]
MANDVWILKRNDTNERIELPQDIRWRDEFEWSKVAQAAPQRTLSGGLIIQQGVKLNGRPITLSGSWVWHTLGTVRRLREWSDTPELEMTLSHYDGREFNVVFRLHDSALGNVEPVRYATPEAGSERYTAEILLMTF